MDYKFYPTEWVVVMTILSHAIAFITKFGKDIRGHYLSGEIGIASIITISLLIGIFSEKDVKKIFFSKKNIIILTVGFLINLPIAIICINNQYLH